MPNNFLQTFYYAAALAFGIAIAATIFTLTITIFMAVFVYVFIPLFIIAGIRWAWLRYKYGSTRITYYDPEK